MDAAGVGLVRASVTDGRNGDDEAGTFEFVAGFAERGVDGGDVHAVDGADDVPVVGAEAGGDVLGERDVGIALDGDVVVVVEVDDLAEPKRAGEGGRLGGDALHEVAVGDDAVDAVVDDLVSGPVVVLCKEFLRDGHADAVGEPLAERAGGHLGAGGKAKLGVARGLALPLPELPDVVERELVAGEVEQRVQEHRGVAGGQHESVAVGPEGVGGVVLEEPVPQRIGHRGGAHRGAGMAAVRLLDRVDRKEADRIDGEVVDGGGGSLGRHAASLSGSAGFYRSRQSKCADGRLGKTGRSRGL